MPAAVVLTVWLASGLIAGTIGGQVSQRKRRHPGFWTTATFLFPPLLLVLVFLPRGNWRPPPPEWDPDNLDRL